MHPFGRLPPRGFPGAMPPPIAGMGGHPPHMRPPPMVVGGGGVVPSRGGPMMFAPPPLGPRGMVLPPPGTGLGPRGPMLFGAPGVHAAGPPGVGSSAPPPPGTVDIPVPVVELPDTGPMNVFVGKLPPDLHDNYIRQLLEKCGTVVTWKRTTDPVTGKPKGFGYCTFSTANDVLRALRLLDGFAVDSREILLKVDSKTQTKLDVITKAMTEKMKLEEQERDEEIQQSLRNLFQVRSGHMGGQQNDVATWGELLEKKAADEQAQQQQQSGEQASDIGAGEREKADSGDQRGEAPSGVSSDGPVEGEKIRGSMIMKEVEKFRLAQEQREQEQEQKRREAVLERLRREKEDEEKRRAADERRKAADERRRAAEEKRKAEEDAARVAKAEAAAARKKGRENRESGGGGDERDEYDSETDGREDENGGSGSSRRKPSSSRRREREDRDRKKRSTRERSRDRDRDRKRGRDHRSRSRSRSRERSSRRRRHRKSRSRSRSRTRSRSRSRHRGDRERDRASRRKRRHRRDSSTDKYRSDDDEERKRSSKRKRDSAKDKRADDDEGRTERDETYGEETGSPSKVERSSSQSRPEIPVVEAPKPVVMPKVVLGLRMASGTVKKEKPVTIPAVSAFVVEEEVEAKPLRELVPIDYTEEEKLAGASVQQRVAATVARINSRSGDVKSLIDQIPTETAELFAYPIDWRAVDQNKIVQEKMEPWVKKKIVEYLGEDEPTLMEFLLKKLEQRAQAQEILNELQLVLDDDAEVFVKLLWRKLAFEAIRVSSP